MRNILIHNQQAVAATHGRDNNSGSPSHTSSSSATRGSVSEVPMGRCRQKRHLGCVPIAPLPPAGVSSVISSANCARRHQHHLHTATRPESSIFRSEALSHLDVLLKKGGRPTHGKKRFFQKCQSRAAEYASFKSPIDRRLLARSLVEQWIEQDGGRFCISISGTKENDCDSLYGYAVDRSTSHKQGSKSTRTAYFRVASTEEALLFTRRVLVRHFTPSMSKRTKKTTGKIHKSVMDVPAITSTRTASSNSSIVSSSSSGSNVTATATVTMSSSNLEAPPLTLPLQSIQVQNTGNTANKAATDTTKARSDAANALCFLRTTAPAPAPSCCVQSTLPANSALE